MVGLGGVSPAAGDKAENWEGWWREAIPLADERFVQHLAILEAEGSER